MDFKCRRCHRPGKVSAEQNEVFERMHDVWFHYEFEHDDFDVDEECSAGGCSSASLAQGRDQVIATARELAQSSLISRRPPADGRSRLHGTQALTS